MLKVAKFSATSIFNEKCFKYSLMEIISNGLQNSSYLGPKIHTSRDKANWVHFSLLKLSAKILIAALVDIA